MCPVFGLRTLTFVLCSGIQSPATCELRARHFNLVRSTHEMEEEMKIQQKSMKSMSLPLTAEQKEAISKFWAETKSIGTVEIEVDVVGDKISPASI